jgi:hypothetical protein
MTNDFLHALSESKLISPGKLADLLSWQHSGFHIDGGKRPVPAHHTDGRKRLAQPERGDRAPGGWPREG